MILILPYTFCLILYSLQILLKLIWFFIWISSIKLHYSDANPIVLKTHWKIIKSFLHIIITVIQLFIYFNYLFAWFIYLKCKIKERSFRGDLRRLTQSDRNMTSVLTNFMCIISYWMHCKADALAVILTWDDSFKLESDLSFPTLLIMGIWYNRKQAIPWNRQEQ